MPIPKLPPPPSDHDGLVRWAHQLYEFLGKASTDGLAKTNGKLTMRSNSIPPVPLLAQELTALPIGFEFRFNFITDATVDGYWIYKNTVDDPLTASRYKFIPQSVDGGVYTFQDTTGQAISTFYWVSAINGTGESAKVATSSGGTTSLTPSQTNTSYRPTVASGDYTDPSAAYDNNLNIGSVGRAV
jgi:hypothetical protein